MCFVPLCTCGVERLSAFLRDVTKSKRRFSRPISFLRLRLSDTKVHREFFGDFYSKAAGVTAERVYKAVQPDNQHRV